MCFHCFIYLRLDIANNVFKAFVGFFLVFMFHWHLILYSLHKRMYLWWLGRLFDWSIFQRGVFFPIGSNFCYSHFSFFQGWRFNITGVVEKNVVVWSNRWFMCRLRDCFCLVPLYAILWLKSFDIGRWIVFVFLSHYSLARIVCIQLFLFTPYVFL